MNKLESAQKQNRKQSVHSHAVHNRETEHAVTQSRNASATGHTKEKPPGVLCGCVSAGRAQKGK